jgi:hypothetical protein
VTVPSTPIHERRAPVIRPEPRWPAIIAALAAVALHYALPVPLRLTPRPWVLAIVVVLLLIGTTISRRMGYQRAYTVMSYSILVVLTGGLVFGVVRLVMGVVNHAAAAPELLQAASVLWVSNVIVFASWYWRLDAGGPNARERREAHTLGAFLFPQMTYDSPNADDMTIAEEQSWRPHFVDYLFVSFNTSTAFSPTDAPVLSRWAKMAMMVQAIISFTTVVLIAARAVNIL